MVNEYIINSIITKSIIKVKCGQRLTLNNPHLINSLNKFHNKYATPEYKVEFAQLLDNNGNVVYLKEGNKSSVELSDEEILDIYRDYGEMHITHNHPSGVPPAVCLSENDVNFIFHKYEKKDNREVEDFIYGYDVYYPFKSITCESSIGARMTLVRGDNFSYNDNYYKVVQAQRRLRRYFHDYIDGYRYTRGFIKRKTNMEDFNTFGEFNEYLDNEVFKEMGSFEKTDEFKEIQNIFREANCRLTYEYI